MTELADGRGSPRVSCDVAVEYEVRGTPTRQGRMRNIGITGALLTTPEADPPVGAEVLVSFHLPISQRPVRTLGKVRWARHGKAGVEFIHLGLQEKDEIWRYYARESAQQKTRDEWRQFIRESHDIPTEPE